MYKKIIRPILFLFSAETAHKIVMKLLVISRWLRLGPILRLIYSPKSKGLERELFGLKFKNPIGIAGGLDKNGDCYNELANFGFSFIEIGSLTPKPQAGNPKPRIFRVPENQAIINRMGINNQGVRHAIGNLSKRPRKVIVAGNITKGTDTPNELAYKDYERSFSMLYDFVDFFVLNVSCPNVKNLTELQDIAILGEILDHLITLRRFNDSYRPIFLKISPDIPIEQINEIIELALVSGIEGIVATNTTRSREGLSIDKEQIDKIGNGGMSGGPLFERSLHLVKHIHKKSHGLLTIIACGGIMNPLQAKLMLDAGASLIEVYSGFIYNGPGFVKDIIKYITPKENKKHD
ncbi:MAG: quinone-dependent dihydroorotate dehydrogenase [Bacteroidales bacterium]|nr:quinone-dependent dihydroorotate dehydrogenase [Bacteroidales bacterium]